MASEHDYKLSAKDTAAELGTDTEKGLTIEKAHERLHSRGRNAIRLTRMHGALSGIWRHAFSLMNVVLILMAAMYLAAVGTDAVPLSLGFVLCAIVNTAVGYINFRPDSLAAHSAREAQEQNVHVMRGGQKRMIPAVLLVQGDIIFLEKGCTVPADVQILECDAVVADESIINGESTSVVKIKDEMLYLGTKLLGGRAKAVVTAVGDNTQLGATIGMLGNSRAETSALARKNKAIGNIFGAMAAAVWLCAFILRLSGGYGVISALDNSVSAAASALPIALSPLLLAAVSFDIMRLKKSGVEVRSASAVEAVGTADVLCLGKRGTLTEKGFFVGKVQPFGGFDENRLRLLGAMCTTVELDGGEPVGDELQAALVRNALENGFSAYDIRKRFPIIKITDNRVNDRLMITEHKTENGTLSVCKGAPEAVAARCGYIYDGAARHFEPADDLHKIISESNNLSAEAMSVIAVAYSEDSGPFVFAGLIALGSAIRSDTADSVKRLEGMGVRVCLITNENLTTAAATAESCGISGRAINGNQADMSLPRQLRTVAVFAETEPNKKADIVAALNSGRGSALAVGRSVRDIGAMNNSAASLATGTSAKICWGAADIRVSGSGLGRVTDAISQCKRSFINIERMIEFLLSCNVAMALCVVASLAAGYSSPFSPVGIMWLNLTGVILGAVGIWLEPYHRISGDKERLRGIKSGRVSGTVIWCAALRGIAMSTAALASASGLTASGRRTAVYLTLCIAMAFMAQSCRSDASVLKRAFKNPTAAVCFILAVAMAAVSLLWGEFRYILWLDKIKSVSVMLCIAVGLLPTVLAELMKLTGKNKGIKGKKHER